ncbi:Taxilin domain-containing protein [Rhizoctonia solani AG-1 IA]|uniref:Taxilin domain-containing protein n=1 Tax=Thanatephorus cucumeris (strain AG1-IA) TaxID=983506 RepID=L8WQK2_THACA|nr:Taxilin domain-containing protein [Rhizoctonia solani AG-1 IA]
MASPATTHPPSAKPPPTGPPPRPTPNANGNGTRPPPQRKNPNANNPNVKVEPSAPPDPMAMYETLKNRIAVLEEEEVTVEEEERRLAEEARRTVKGMSDSAVQTKYIELVSIESVLCITPLTLGTKTPVSGRLQAPALLLSVLAAKMQYNKASQARTKLENLARELQKDNKKLRVFEEARDEINQVKDELVQRQMAHPRFFTQSRVDLGTRKPLVNTSQQQLADIVVKVVCKFREELFFKINRKTKLTRLFSTWESRMDTGSSDKKSGKTHFIFTHAGRAIDWESTPDQAGIENNDVIMAVELMDLTQAEPVGPCAILDDAEATRAVEEMLDVVVRERLKDVLRQYERRERHFEAVVRSKELEVLLARARVEEQKGCAEVARRVARASEQQNAALQTELEELQRQEAATATKLQQCLHTLGKNSSADPAPAAARIVRDVLWEHLDLRAQAIEHDTNNHASGEDS